MSSKEAICFGSNFYGQLGIGDVQRPSASTPFRFGRLEIDDKNKSDSDLKVDIISDIQCGSKFTVVLYNNGQMMFTGLMNDLHYTKLTPIKVEFSPRVTQVSCGINHILALLEGGYVVSWGIGYFGQLGHGDDTSWDKPRLIHSLEPHALGSKIVQIEAGGYHSGAITESGIMFMWGHNKHGQCGVRMTSNRKDDNDSIFYPRPVDQTELRGERPIRLVCGRNHSACITITGKVYTWGAAGFGRLGQMDARKKEPVPSPVTHFLTKPIRDLASGDYHMLALSEDRRVYSWGFSHDGQCGYGGTMNVRTPRRMEFFDDKLVKSVHCGASWASVVTESGELYSWGYNDGAWTGVKVKSKSKMAFVEPDQPEGRSTHTWCFDSNHNILKPQRVKFKKSVKVDNVACGGTHSIVICSGTFAGNQQEGEEDAFSDSGGENETSDRPVRLVRRRSTVQGIPQNASPNRQPSSASNPNISELSEEDQAATMISWVRHKKEAEIAYALGQGVNVNIKDPNGNTPLLTACQNGHKSIATFLIEHGANVNSKNSKGNSSLHYSLAYKFQEIATMLIREGADEFALNDEGMSPYEGLTQMDLEKL